MSRSLQYWKSRRARSRLPRVRNHSTSDKTTISNIVCFKAGMARAFILDDSNSSTKGSEVMRASTVLEVPKTECYGARVYRRDENTGYLIPSYEVYSEEAAKRAGIKRVVSGKKLEDIQKDNNTAEISALMVAYPDTTNSEQNKRVRFESRLIGNSNDEKIKFIHDNIGKEIKSSDIFTEGEHIDITSITKGKGWQGVIKRGGVRRNNHKATNKVRHGGPLGAFTPGKVLYTIPRAGQQGYNYRTEQNKRILKIATNQETKSINPKSGFKNYGLVRNDFLVVQGSVGGPSKRMVRIKKAIRHNSKKTTKPKLTWIG